jgi:hypothetical protein
MKAGMDPTEATSLRQTRLEVRESEAQHAPDQSAFPSRNN